MLWRCNSNSLKIHECKGWLVFSAITSKLKLLWTWPRSMIMWSCCCIQVLWAVCVVPRCHQAPAGGRVRLQSEDSQQRTHRRFYLQLHPGEPDPQKWSLPKWQVITKHKLSTHPYGFEYLPLAMTVTLDHMPLCMLWQVIYIVLLFLPCLMYKAADTGMLGSGSIQY